MPFDQLCNICIELESCFSWMIKARASGSKVYLYFMKKGRQARHRIPRNSCGFTINQILLTLWNLCSNPPQIQGYKFSETKILSWPLQTAILYKNSSLHKNILNYARLYNSERIVSNTNFVWSIKHNYKYSLVGISSWLSKAQNFSLDYLPLTIRTKI